MSSPLLSHIRRSNQINSIWISPSLNPTNLSIIAHYFGIRDHCCFIVDFAIKIFIGKGFILIVKLKISHLTFS